MQGGVSDAGGIIGRGGARLAGALALIVCGAGCRSGAPSSRPAARSPVVAKGERRFAIDVNAARDKNYERAYQLARRSGADEAVLFLNWRDLEPSPGRYQGDELLQTADVTYAAYGMPLHLTITPIHTNVDVRPDDLRGRPMNDPEVVARYQAMLDHVLSRLPRLRIRSVVLCSEFDALFGSDADRYEELAEWARRVREHVKARLPETAVALEATMPALLRHARQPLQRLNASMDWIGASYYPLNDDFTVRAPEAALDDMAELAGLYAGRPIAFYQLGYPSGRGLRSSESRQAAFIRASFEAWDRHADQVAFISFTWLHDVSRREAEGLAGFYGGGGVAPFVEFLSTLGLRRADGVDKPAFRALLEEARARGWESREHVWVTAN